jgi:glutamate racemase
VKAQPASSTPANTNNHAGGSYVGVLDSGVGGLSVLREIHRLLPGVPTLYYADQAHLPYGPRPPDEIRSFVSAIAEFLIGQGAAVIVLACHSASAASLHDLRAKYPHVPIVGMEPAVKPAAEATRSGVVAVLTTQATANGALYRRVVARHAANVKVITRVSPDLVEMVERGTHDLAYLAEIVQPLTSAGADQIVLACTHFPFLSHDLAAVTPVTLVDPSAAVARQAGRVLPTGLAAIGHPNRYYTSGDPDAFAVMLRRLIGEQGDVRAVSAR